MSASGRLASEKRTPARSPTWRFAGIAFCRLCLAARSFTRTIRRPPAVISPWLRPGLCRSGRFGRGQDVTMHGAAMKGAGPKSSGGAAEFSPRREPWVRCAFPVFQPSPGGRGGTAKRWVRVHCSQGSRPGLKSCAPRGAIEPGAHRAPLQRVAQRHSVPLWRVSARRQVQVTLEGWPEAKQELSLGTGLS